MKKGCFATGDLQTGKRSKEFAPHRGYVEPLGYTTDGKIIGGNHNGVFIRWDANNRQGVGEHWVATKRPNCEQLHIVA